MLTSGSNSAPQHLFVYGTLVDPLKLDEVIGHRHMGERLRARLHGFERIAPGDYPYPYLVPSPDAAVEGILVMDLSATDFDALDVYEEVALGLYERLRVEVEAWGCGPHSAYLQAHTYVGGARLTALPRNARSAMAQPTGSTAR